MVNIIDNIISLVFSPIMAVTTAVLVSSLWFATGGDHQYTPEQRGESAVLITGASRGIGKAMALHLSSLGYTVFGSVRSQSSFDELAGAAKGKIIPLKFDVTEDEDIGVAVTNIEQICKERGLEFVGIINNAGINPEGDRIAKALVEKDAKPLDNILADTATVTRVMNTNVIGCFRVTRAFLPILTKEKGRVILVGSYFGTLAGAIDLPHLAYESSKHALEGLADGLRRGLKKEGIRVSLIKPGNIDTDMNPLGDKISPSVVSLDVLAALEANKPKARYYPGAVKGIPTRLLCAVFGLFPSWITDKLL
uniref:Uncharacterized protein n=1 Tax=Pseudo-nitzschia australis TaxID=44445 RepID=A0A7S4ATN8_9STRA|mmetsp:Transcript_15067/g.32327  ORF Transcript_15067/g.32327 Transcript_15067/m.32327 type:complete len:308 (-) Transcript_15067:280-1203(-)